MFEDNASVQHYAATTDLYQHRVPWTVLGHKTTGALTITHAHHLHTLVVQEIVVARAIVSLVLSGALLRRAGVSPWGRDRRWLWIRGLLGFGGLSCQIA